MLSINLELLLNQTMSNTPICNTILLTCRGRGKEGGRWVGNERIKLNLERRWGDMERKEFIFCLCLLSSHSNWEYINFPQVKSILPVMVIGKWAPWMYLDPWAFPPYFLPSDFLLLLTGRSGQQLGRRPPPSQGQAITVPMLCVFYIPVCFPTICLWN